MIDEVFGEENCIAVIAFSKTSGSTREFLGSTFDYILLYARNKARLKFRPVYHAKELGGMGTSGYTFVQDDSGGIRKITDDDRNRLGKGGLRVLTRDNLTSQSIGRDKGEGAASWFPVQYDGQTFRPSVKGRWKTNETGMQRLVRARRLTGAGKTLRYVRYLDDFPAFPVSDYWSDTTLAGFASNKRYIVETATKVVERCILMATDPGDLVLDPTSGSGTTAYVAEQWGRRWIAVDSSRVALALARARIMGARYPYYLLADSHAGQLKLAELARAKPSVTATRGNIRQGFVYETIPHIMLKTIASNSEIDAIWEQFQERLEGLRDLLNGALGKNWEEWEIPRHAEITWSSDARDLHRQWWETRIARQAEIDASIAAGADFEYLYDKPYKDKSKVRVAGPFTVESLSPHRVLTVDEDDEILGDWTTADEIAEPAPRYDLDDSSDFAQMILDHLKTSGVQQAHKEDRITFTAITGWPGEFVCAEGRYLEGDEASGTEKRAGILIGPEFGTVSRPDLVAAAREAGDADFDVLIACAFNYDAHSADFDKLGRIPILKAHMNADLHMANELKNTGQGNLFVIFGEPDIDLFPAEGEDAKEGQLQVRINGVDVFHPQTGEVRSDGAEGIACWFIDTDYNEESFFVRHAYFLGANDPYKSLKTTLKAEIDPEAWATLNSDTSRPFDPPASGRIAVKVINHLGDEVMKVYRVP